MNTCSPWDGLGQKCKKVKPRWHILPGPGQLAKEMRPGDLEKISPSIYLTHSNPGQRSIALFAMLPGTDQEGVKVSYPCLNLLLNRLSKPVNSLNSAERLLYGVG